MGRIGVEGSDDLKALFAEAAVTKQGRAKIPHANHHHRLEHGEPHDSGDRLGESDDAVAESARAKLTDVAKVLPELGRLHSGGAGEVF